jgi:hypothetical protein
MTQALWPVAGPRARRRATWLQSVFVARLECKVKCTRGAGQCNAKHLCGGRSRFFSARSLRGPVSKAERADFRSITPAARDQFDSAGDSRWPRSHQLQWPATAAGTGIAGHTIETMAAGGMEHMAAALAAVALSCLTTERRCRALAREAEPARTGNAAMIGTEGETTAAERTGAAATAAAGRAAAAGAGRASGTAGVTAMAGTAVGTGRAPPPQDLLQAVHHARTTRTRGAATPTAAVPGMVPHLLRAMQGPVAAATAAASAPAGARSSSRSAGT